MDRRDYKARSEASKMFPEDYLSLCHDGMSKCRTRIPLNNVHNSKDIEDIHKLCCNINAVLLHLQGKLGLKSFLVKKTFQMENAMLKILAL